MKKAFALCAVSVVFGYMAGYTRAISVYLASESVRINEYNKRKASE